MAVDTHFKSRILPVRFFKLSRAGATCFVSPHRDSPLTESNERKIQARFPGLEDRFDRELVCHLVSRQSHETQLHGDQPRGT